MNLRHPNIPILYDLEEDENYYYMVEEYIVGESMADYLYLHQSISHRELIRIAIELYDVLDYLHSLSIPICYQDMKLEHIYLSKGRIVLIDYGIATYLRDNENSIYGTLSYASEAQLAGKCDIKNDIYNTKVALRRIYDTSLQRRNFSIERLLNVNNNGSAAEEKAKWILIGDMTKSKRFFGEKQNRIKKHLDVKVAVVGNDTAIGVSHIAISLNCYLNNLGIVSYYEDYSGKNVIENIMARDRGFNEKDNIIYHDCFKGVRQSGDAVIETIPPKGLYVIDCGTDVSCAKSADAIIYVISSRSYKSNEIDEIAFAKSTQVIVNPKSVGVGVDVAGLLGKKVYSFPIDKDPFSVTKTKDKVLGQLIRKLSLDGTGSEDE